MTDRQLTKAVRQFRAGILGTRQSWLMCFAVCAPLQAYLGLCGVDTELVSVNFVDCNHVWLRLTDGRILDPTADQFGLPAVYLGPLPLTYATRQARLAIPAPLPDPETDR